MFDPSSAAQVYTGWNVAHQCACRCPGTFWSKVISRHTVDYNITCFLQCLWLLMILHISLHQMKSFKMVDKILRNFVALLLEIFIRLHPILTWPHVNLQNFGVASTFLSCACSGMYLLLTTQAAPCWQTGQPWPGEPPVHAGCQASPLAPQQTWPSSKHNKVHITVSKHTHSEGTPTDIIKSPLLQRAQQRTHACFNIKKNLSFKIEWFPL